MWENHEILVIAEYFMSGGELYFKKVPKHMESGGQWTQKCSVCMTVGI